MHRVGFGVVLALVLVLGVAPAVGAKTIRVDWRGATVFRITDDAVRW